MAAYWDWGPDGDTGRVSLTNSGTTATWPLLRVTGGLEGGFIITDVTAGRTIKLDRRIPPDSYVVINQRTGTATLDGDSDVTGFLVGFGFFAIGPGETHDIQFTPVGLVTGEPRLTVTLRDAFL